MGLMKAAGFCVARTLCDYLSALSLPTEPLATQHTREENSGAERDGCGGETEQLSHHSGGFKSQALRVMAQTGRPALLQGRCLAVSPAPGGGGLLPEA